ncbi:Ypar14, super integron cassette [Pseudoalteromonas sp. SMS1]|uniref:Ypar14, super integron cassette n=1 Tax=Pseudoalteromonas sp. SMS1 TaxID=2908894 RepID=UPI001F3BFEFB|nr:Ypar14, super integron cassette [Pseudoalteromonas sp. SMS1]MCF2859169.1 Ypar14, super integron cassette [Pseudoalteromonas sp. SMS1]
MLVWNETDVLTVLEVIPQVECNGIWHLYEVEKEGIKLVIQVFQYDGDVRIELVNTANNVTIFSMFLMDCDGVLRKKDNTGEYLQFAPAKCFSHRYDGETTIPYGVRVMVNPNINVMLYR